MEIQIATSVRNKSIVSAWRAVYMTFRLAIHNIYVTPCSLPNPKIDFIFFLAPWVEEWGEAKR